MGITVSQNERKFELPPEGMHHGVCVDVVDLGMIHSDKWNKDEHKCRIVFQLATKMNDGRPYVITRKFTVSLGEKAHLRPFLETWRGKAFTSEELKAFDLDTLIGVNGMVQVIYDDSGETTYANLNAVMPLMQGMAKIQPQDYTRVQDREQTNQPQTKAATAPSQSNSVPPPPVRQTLNRPTIQDDDIPFSWAIAFFVSAATLASFLSGPISFI